MGRSRLVVRLRRTAKAMTSTPVSNLAQAQTAPVLISKTGKLWIALIGALLIFFHWHLIYRMFRIGMNDPDWSHILIIPLISVYYIHLNRRKLMATPRRVCRLGLPMIVAGIAGYVLGIYPIRNDMAMGYSMVLTLFGIVLLLLGPAMMRTLWFPIAFMVFAIKISDSIWTIIASKMQNIAAYGAVVLLEITSGISGLHAELSGNTINLDYGQANAPTPMNVAEACAGMRMLMAFLALGVALAFLFPRMWWQRLIMVAMAAPIAIFVNALRVAVLGWLHLVDPELAHGDSHLFVGMLMLIPAAGLLMLVGWCLEKIIIVEGKRQKPPAPIPFDEDPNVLHFEKTTAIKGAVVGAAIVTLLGLSYILLINQLAQGDVIKWLGGGINTALLIVASVLFFAGLILMWRITPGGVKPGQLALSQGIVGGLLLAAALGQHTATQSMEVALNKKPVPLRHGIALSFPEQAGDWQLLHHDPKLPKDVEAELGTREYFNRYYINNAAGLNTNNVTARTIETKLGEQLVGWEGKVVPGQIAKVHIAYYTGMLDSVPHVPDKCWVVGAGQRPEYKRTHTLNLSREDYQDDPDHAGLILADSTGFDQVVRLPSDTIDATLFSASNDEGAVNSALYFFLANGDAVASNLDVRFSFNLQDRYSYYCKVEVSFPGVNDPEKIEAYAEDFISHLLPEVMACLPDWTEVQAGKYPTEDQANP